MMMELNAAHQAYAGEDSSGDIHDKYRQGENKTKGLALDMRYFKGVFGVRLEFWIFVKTESGNI
ncbi:MAG: hypothetical protein VB050_15470 [Geobacteraceae bacterium]|nr:hypothetical protein [Geobacteraceae bacterium]